MLTLDHMKPFRTSARLARDTLSTLTMIEADRLRDLERKQAEPWLDEAHLIARVLNTNGILPLLGAADIYSVHLPFDFPDELLTDKWVNGLRLPLAPAIRLCQMLGLPDPDVLFTNPFQRQLWSVVSSSERLPSDRPGMGLCPWCCADIHAGEPHAKTCLPTILWARHDIAPSNPELAAVAHLKLMPEDNRVKYRSVARVAVGLKRMRERLNLRQIDVADGTGINVTYYARLEQGTLPTTMAKAAVLAKFFRVTIPEIYAPAQ